MDALRLCLGTPCAGRFTPSRRVPPALRRLRLAARRARPPVARVRWDRIARVGMLGVLVVLLTCTSSAGASIFSTWRSAAHHRAAVAALMYTNRQLRGQQSTLAQSGTIVAEARRLGMVRTGERAYIIEGLPSN